LKAIFLGLIGSWRNVADAANTTVHKESGDKEPSSLWKRRILLCEHSPIRQIFLRIKWFDLGYWVSVHLVRHKYGIEHFVRSQRTDRTDTDRDQLTQNNPVEHEIMANTQACIYISRKRLCNKAAPETREAWKAALETIRNDQPELYEVCVPDCIYRGWCFELRSCGFHKTVEFQQRLQAYRRDINA